MTKLPIAALPQLYTHLMIEVKERLSESFTQHQLAQQNIDKPGGYIHCEYCYLHIRRCIELIGIGVLLAHNQIDNFRHKDIMKDWNAESLFGRLARISDDAFPEPLTERANNLQDGSIDLIIGFSAKENRKRLKSIYSSCGNGLHTGSLRDIIKSGGKRYNISEIVEWNNFIVGLINMHAIILPNQQGVMVVRMSTHPDNKVICILHPHGHQRSAGPENTR